MNVKVTKEEKVNMKAKVKVITNNDIAYIWWSIPKKIPGCLGFSIHREEEGRTPKPLLAWVGFEKVKKPMGPRNTDIWPIQSFQWKDVYAPREGRFRYHIYAVHGTPEFPERDSNPIVTSSFVYRSGKLAWSSTVDSFRLRE
ncbi:MAG: hypothetical protein AB1630_04625 [bacterium]